MSISNSKNKKLQWHHVYYVLAFIDVLTILFSLWLNHNILQNFTHSVEVNHEWAIRLGKFAELSTLAGKVNAPGNDVFDSKDVLQESARMKMAKEEFDARFLLLQKEIQKDVPQAQGRIVLDGMVLVEKAMQDMIHEAQQIFTFFQNSQEEEAGQRMATMDRKFAILAQQIADLNAKIRDIQSEHLREQQALSKKLVKYEYLIVLIIFLIVIAVTVYGRKLSAAIHKAEQEKEKSFYELENHKKALDQHAIVSIADLKGNIIYANDQFCQISGYTKQELIGQNHRIVNSGYHDPEFWKKMWKTIASGEVWQGQIKNKAKEGTYYWVDSTIYPFKDGNGKIFQYYSIRTDITLKKLQEEEIIQAKKDAEVANKVKGQFLANMSHEIRTPLNAVLGFSDLLKRTKVDEQQKQYLNTILSSGELLLAIINDILDLSKLQSGKIDLESIDFDLEYLVVDVFKLVHSKMADKKINTFIRIDPQVPKQLKGDPTRLRQIILNLLSNAVKFTEQGQVGVEVALVEHQQDDLEYLLQFSVVDSGIGIPKDRIDDLFKEFIQVDQSTTRKYGGTGLGLAICKSLVEIMGGKIWIESQVNQGSKFIFTTRLKKGNQSALAPIPSSQFKDIKVFVLEDHQDAQELMVKYLQEYHFQIVGIASSVQQAILKLDQLVSKTLIPDLIISDVMMPEKDGYDFIKYLRAHKSFGHVKVLAVSSDVHMGVTKKLEQEGFNGFLAKPYTQVDLINMISYVLGQGQENQPIITRHQVNEQNLSEKRPILVVEDVEANQMLMKACFDIMQLKVEFANNGQEAVDLLREHQDRYALCFMDLQMPVLGGIEASHIIREHINQKIPIIALTAAVFKEDRERCSAAGMNDFLMKPVNMERLKTILQKYQMIN